LRNGVQDAVNVLKYIQAAEHVFDGEFVQRRLAIKLGGV
jgi:hypothetical protein